MCLAVVALDAHPRYRLVIAANRDEFHARAASPANWWPDDGMRILAGRDLAAGGTWLGITPRGRWALVTNVRDPSRNDPSKPSRGALVGRLLRDARPARIALDDLLTDGARYNGFNLLGGDPGNAHWASNRADRAHSLAPGLHGLSNAGLDTPWPKVVRVKGALAAWTAEGTAAIEPLFDALADRTLADDDALPSTGVSRERERMLSAPFIVSDTYGTRCSTVVTVDRDGAARFFERTFDARGDARGDVDERFRLSHA